MGTSQTTKFWVQYTLHVLQNPTTGTSLSKEQRDVSFSSSSSRRFCPTRARRKISLPSYLNHRGCRSIKFGFGHEVHHGWTGEWQSLSMLIRSREDFSTRPFLSSPQKLSLSHLQTAQAIMEEFSPLTRTLLRHNTLTAPRHCAALESDRTTSKYGRFSAVYYTKSI